jgi:hypothetical protein
MALIRFLTIALIIYFAWKLVVRIFLPMLGNYAVRKATENLKEQSQRARNGDKVYQRGDMTIRKPADPSKKGGSERDFTEYEEVGE